MSTLFLSVICIIGFIIASIVKKTAQAEGNEDMLRATRIASPACIVLAVVMFLASCLFVVRPGEVGIGVILGRVKPGVFHSGLRFKNPIMSIVRIPTRLQEYTMSSIRGEGRKSEDDAIQALTKEGMLVGLDLTVWYKVNPEKAPEIYEKIGMDYEDKILRPVIRTAIRDKIAQYPTSAVYTEKREQIAIELQKIIDIELVERGFICERALLRNVILPAKVTAAINEKLAAHQDAQKMEFVLQKAQKEAEVRVVEAKGIAEAQKIINRTLTTNYLQHEAITIYKDLANSENTTFVIMPTSTKGTGLPLIIGK